MLTALSDIRKKNINISIEEKIKLIKSIIIYTPYNGNNTDSNTESAIKYYEVTNLDRSSIQKTDDKLSAINLDQSLGENKDSFQRSNAGDYWNLRTPEKL